MIKAILSNRQVLIVLFIINLFGTFYGFYWYRYQLAETPVIFTPFVPDSPMASLFFTIVLLFFLFHKQIPYIEALAVMTLFKYGIWAVVMNALTLFTEGSIGAAGYMLIISHGAMAVEGLLYIPFYKIKWRHIVVAAVWILHNDIIDYVFGHMPVYSSLMNYMEEIGYFTFWLSIISISVVYILTIKKKTVKSV